MLCLGQPWVGCTWGLQIHLICLYSSDSNISLPHIGCYQQYLEDVRFLQVNILHSSRMCQSRYWRIFRYQRILGSLQMPSNLWCQWWILNCKGFFETYCKEISQTGAYDLFYLFPYMGINFKTQWWTYVDEHTIFVLQVWLVLVGLNPIYW